MNVGNFHSQDIKNLVRAYWLEGVPQREIARRVGISRNTVPGIVRRMGLPQRTTPDRPARGWVAHHIKIAAPKAPEAIGPIGDFPGRKSCHYIAGEPDANFQCCAQPGYPYCEYHAKRCHTKAWAPV